MPVSGFLRIPQQQTLLLLSKTGFNEYAAHSCAALSINP
jgi:hypothetical protein